MIPIVLIISAVIGAAAAVGITICFWDEIKLFLKETWEELKKQTTLFIKGCKVFLRKIKRGITTAVKVIASYYAKTDQHWERVSFVLGHSLDRLCPTTLQQERIIKICYT